ncbi:MAG: hypothetical protein IKI50_04855 [Clostridia bacterium]|nr:hypothetical protein [Clostridia bacterium]
MTKQTKIIVIIAAAAVLALAGTLAGVGLACGWFGGKEPNPSSGGLTPQGQANESDLPSINFEDLISGKTTKDDTTDPTVKPTDEPTQGSTEGSADPTDKPTDPTTKPTQAPPTDPSTPTDPTTEPTPAPSTDPSDPTDPSTTSETVWTGPTLKVGEDPDPTGFGPLL